MSSAKILDAMVSDAKISDVKDRTGTMRVSATQNRHIKEAGKSPRQAIEN
jgi:hypothetical protein